MGLASENGASGSRYAQETRRRFNSIDRPRSSSRSRASARQSNRSVPKGVLVKHAARNPTFLRQDQELLFFARQNRNGRLRDLRMQKSFQLSTRSRNKDSLRLCGDEKR